MAPLDWLRNVPSLPRRCDQYQEWSLLTWLHCRLFVEGGFVAISMVFWSVSHFVCGYCHALLITLRLHCLFLQNFMAVIFARRFFSLYIPGSMQWHLPFMHRLDVWAFPKKCKQILIICHIIIRVFKSHIEMHATWANLILWHWQC